jgi:mono/diheme cytochrome c family protein
LKIYSLKRNAIPKIAVLATGLTAAVLVATISPQAAQATPRASNCTGCHADAAGAVSTVTATPSTANPAPGASYTVAITLTANPTGGNTGYGIVPIAPAVEKTFGGNTGSELAFTATMVAPAAAGTYSYTVWTNQGPTSAGLVGSKVYSITVAPVVTIPPTTIPPTTIPPTTIPPTTIPPTTIPPTTIPPTTIPPTTIPPTTTVPPVAKAAIISGLTPKHGVVGTIVTINGSGFGALGSVQCGSVVTTASSWSDTQIVFEVPAGLYGRVAPVSVIPGSDTASNAVSFRIDKVQHPHHSSWYGPRHHSHFGGDDD